MAILDNSTNICRTCKAEKPIGEFYPTKHRAGQVYSLNVCKTCHSARVQAAKAKALQDPNEVERRRAWRRDHKRKIRAGLINKDRLLRAQKDDLRRLERRRIEDAKAEQTAHVKAWIRHQRLVLLRKKRLSKPSNTLNNRMTVGIRRALREQKNGRAWELLVGYTSDDLARHIERQFEKGMSWSNMREWHIDHIIPRKSFSFSSPEDLEFKACWALTNLRPLWAADNLEKRARRTVLL